MRRIYVYSGSICLLVLSLWFGWWVFALVGVVLLVVNRYGYAAALVAGAISLGFTTTVLPAAIAPTSGERASISG